MASGGDSTELIGTLWYRNKDQNLFQEARAYRHELELEPTLRRARCNPNAGVSSTAGSEIVVVARRRIFVMPVDDVIEYHYRSSTKGQKRTNKRVSQYEEVMIET